MQTFSLVNQDGSCNVNESELPSLNPDEWRELYTVMVRLKQMDEVSTWVYDLGLDEPI